MRRLVACLILDVRLQARNRLYPIGLAVALALGLAGRWTLEAPSLRLLLPVFYLLAMGGTTYLFVGGMILLERGEGTLDSVRVSPLRGAEYLLSKVLTLTAFASIECGLVLLLALGPGDVDLVPLAAGAATMGALYTLIGIAQVAPHRSVTDWLVPGVLVVSTVLQLPVLGLLDWIPSPLWYLVPTHGPGLLLAAAFRPIAPWQWVYALAYTALALVAAWIVARRRFERHVMQAGSA